jgi:hypothetical protein
MKNIVLSDLSRIDPATWSGDCSPSIHHCRHGPSKSEEEKQAPYPHGATCERERAHDPRLALSLA